MSQLTFPFCGVVESIKFSLRCWTKATFASPIDYIFGVNCLTCMDVVS